MLRISGWIIMKIKNDALMNIQCDGYLNFDYKKNGNRVASIIVHANKICAFTS